MIDTNTILAAIVISALGGSGLVGLFFWLFKRSMEKNDDALATTLKELHDRQDEHGKRLHSLETAGLVTATAMEARLGPLDSKLDGMGTTVATMKGHMEGMANLAKNLIKNGG